MNKLQEIKEKAKELFDLVDSYEQDVIQDGIKIGRQQVYDRVCHAFVEEMKAQGNLEGKSIKDIPSAERILNASSVVKELFLDLKT